MPAITKAHQKQALAIEESFHRTYASQYGIERWNESLYPALAYPTRYAMLLNRYAASDIDNIIDGKEAGDIELVPFLYDQSAGDTEVTGASPPLHPRLTCYQRVNDLSSDRAVGRPFPVPRSSQNLDDEKRLMTHWNLDAASIFVASVLGVSPGDKVLDLCAAPGGKSVALSQLLCPSTSTGKISLKGGCLHSNEDDNARNKRLNANLQAYIPPSMLKRGEVKVLKVDGTAPNAVEALPLGAGGYDKILVDAPCSGERHIIHAHEKAKKSGRVAEEMMSWRSGQSKKMAKAQAALLITALKAVRLGGIVLYATCSLSNDENDAVVEKAMEMVEKNRKKGLLTWTTVTKSDKLDSDILESWADKTRHGWIVLPDHQKGGKWGPLFLALLEKQSIT